MAAAGLHVEMRIAGRRERGSWLGSDVVAIFR
jgi:hypothetical protein